VTEGWVIEIRRGGGNPRSIALTPGSALEPWSIGMLADWRVEADGMLDVHAFVYFDGTTVYVQSADQGNGVRVNGKAIGTSWTPIAPPCTLAIGDARLVYCPASQASATASAPAPVSRPAAGRAAFDESAPTIADADALPAYDPNVPTERTAAPQRGKPTPPRQPPSRGPANSRPGPAPVARHVPASVEVDDEATSNIPLPTGRGVVEHVEDDNETTRALPAPDLAMAMGNMPRAAAPKFAPPTTALGGPPLGALTAPTAAPSFPEPTAAPVAAPAPPVPTTGPIAAPPQAATVIIKPKPLDQLKQQWKAASLPKKAILFLLPVAFVMVVFGMDDDPPSKRGSLKTTPSTTTATSSSATEDEPKPKPKPKATATAEDLDEPAPKPKPKPSAAPVATASASANSKPANPSTAGSAKTPERVAVDAVAAGSWEPAAKAYDELAQAHPENPAYKEAARILRAKGGKK